MPGVRNLTTRTQQTISKRDYFICVSSSVLSLMTVFAAKSTLRLACNFHGEGVWPFKSQTESISPFISNESLSKPGFRSVQHKQSTDSILSRVFGASQTIVKVIQILIFVNHKGEKFKNRTVSSIDDTSTFSCAFCWSHMFCCRDTERRYLVLCWRHKYDFYCTRARSR